MHAHLPGLQPEPQAQLCVIDGSIAPQQLQSQMEVRQGLLEPAAAGERGPQQPQEKGTSSVPAFLLLLCPVPGTPKGRAAHPGLSPQWALKSPMKGSKDQYTAVALTQI